jgi:hypothetical protein
VPVPVQRSDQYTGEPSSTQQHEAGSTVQHQQQHVHISCSSSSSTSTSHAACAAHLMQQQQRMAAPRTEWSALWQQMRSSSSSSGGSCPGTRLLARRATRSASSSGPDSSDMGLNTCSVWVWGGCGARAAGFRQGASSRECRASAGSAGSTRQEARPSNDRPSCPRPHKPATKQH